ncbi:MAG: phosphotransferase [Planctomycetota bacterium]
MASRGGRGPLAPCLRGSAEAGGLPPRSHQSPPADAPVNPTRGAALAVQQKNIAERIDDLEELGEPPPTRLRTLWEESFLLAPPSATTWIEADLHARNVLVDGGRISAIIDWGDLCAGDPSTDLAAFWMLFDSAEDREAGLVRYGATEEERSRAAGWAILFGVLLLHTGLQDTPRHAAMGRATLARVLEDR